MSKPSADKQAKTFPVGTVVAAHGLDGTIKVRPLTQSPEMLLSVKQLISSGNAEKKPDTFTVRSVTLDKRMLYYRLHNYNTRSEAESLIGTFLEAPDNQIEPLEEDEFWVEDLIGCEVVDAGGQAIGHIKSVALSGTPVLEIVPTSAPEKLILIPFIEQFVPVVDIKAGRITVSAIPGLLEPQ